MSRPRVPLSTFERDLLRPAFRVGGALEFERRSIEWMQARLRRRLVTFVRSGTGAGPLDDGAAGTRRIDAWLKAS